MPRGDRENWGGARISTRSNAKRRGPKPSAVTAEIGKDAMQTLRVLALVRQMPPAALAARWLTERIDKEWTKYDEAITQAQESAWEGEAL